MTAQPAFDLDAHIAAIVAKAPPFTDAQRRKLGPLWATSKALIQEPAAGRPAKNSPAAGHHHTTSQKRTDAA